MPAIALLAMVAEKLGKAYFWRTNRPPRRGHASFVRFLQALDDRPAFEVQRIAKLLGFGRAEDLENWIPVVAPLAYAIERLAPDLASDGPNPEYPWPFHAPVSTPASYDFPVWSSLTESGRGRDLLHAIDAAVRHFPEYA
ncbi:MAG TPA: hypothetical protein VG055_18720 [Planctomycetaceae bacterium]|jgi:hypothetical protein|nr:hypothetical protein [Planctomycetaceae bacterium]